MKVSKKTGVCSSEIRLSEFRLLQELLRLEMFAHVDLCIVVSNQPVIARGDCTFDDLKAIHDKMETLLGKEGAFVDAIYYCPHHPNKGFEGERVEYKTDCDCRKPKPGLFFQSAKDWNINLSASYMIGDSERDVAAGNSAGCKQSYLIKTNEPEALLSIVNKII